MKKKKSGAFGSKKKRKDRERDLFYCIEAHALWVAKSSEDELNECSVHVFISMKITSLLSINMRTYTYTVKKERYI